MYPTIIVRSATPADIDMLAHLLRQADCRYPSGLGLRAKKLLSHFLLLTAWKEGEIEGCLGLNLVRPAIARIEVMVIHRRQEVDNSLERILSAAEGRLRGLGVEALAYIGGDLWPTAALLRQGFWIANSILVLRKQGWEIPSTGNESVSIRPVMAGDIPALVRLDEAAFQEDLWRNDAESFRRCLNRMPHFIVAERERRIVGYQFSDIQRDKGYLARAAVHPEAQGQRIGVRLVAEAIQFFKSRGIRDIFLNTQSDNLRAQRLYKWLGFRVTGQEAVVLERQIAEPG